MRSRRCLVVGLALVALSLPALAGSVPSVADTWWRGTGTLVVKVKGKGKIEKEYECRMSFHDEMTLSWDCQEVGESGRKGGDYWSWEQRGKRILLTWHGDIESGIASSYSEVTGEEAREVLSARVKAGAKLRPRKKTLTAFLRMKGRVVGEDGKKHRVRYRFKMRDATGNLSK